MHSYNQIQSFPKYSEIIFLSKIISFFSVLYILGDDNINNVSQLFKSKEVNPYGVYCISLCNDGELVDLIIDDYIPFDNKKNMECFSKGNEGTVWVQLLEKAFAKLYGSYYNLERVELDNIFDNITCAPILTYNSKHKDAPKIMDEIYRYNWTMFASSGETASSRDLLKDIGLFCSYFYPIEKVLNYKC